MLKLKQVVMISLVSMTISCSVTAKLPLPTLPNYPKLTEQELQLLSECTQCLEALRKIAIKDQMCRSSLKEHRAVIEATQ